jgi:hypothetical protein
MAAQIPGPQPAEPLTGTDLARWGALVVVLVLGGLFLAARAGDDFMQVSAFLFMGLGFVLAARLLQRWHT